MLTVVTGAGGFVGRAVARRMVELGYEGDVRLVDRDQETPPCGRFEWLSADLSDPHGLAAAVRDADRVIHLAALPGGAAETDPRHSRRLNLEATLDLAELLAEAGRRPRLVVASSIAVFGHPLPAAIDDDTMSRPSSTYGTHKLMAEIGLADIDRRGALSAIALRLPGIVARPPCATGFGSAFMSDLFWAVAGGEPLSLPVGPEATMWLMSASRCADNLLNAAACALAEDRQCALTLPALRVRMDELVAAIGRVCGGDTDRIAYAPDPAVERAFGSQPPLTTAGAEALGFRHDGDIDRLVRAALREIHETRKDAAA